METRRKRNKPKKWYVVWKGVNPGIYDSWQQCKEVGQPQGNDHRSFRSYEEAYAAFNGTTPDAEVQANEKPSILSVDDVNALLSAKRYKKSASAYTPEIEAMKPGEGLIIKMETWHRKTNVAAYFHSKFNKGGIRIIGTRKLLDGSYLVFKH